MTATANSGREIGHRDSVAFIDYCAKVGSKMSNPVVELGPYGVVVDLYFVDISYGKARWVYEVGPDRFGSSYGWFGASFVGDNWQGWANTQEYRPMHSLCPGRHVPSPNEIHVSITAIPVSDGYHSDPYPGTMGSAANQCRCLAQTPRPRSRQFSAGQHAS